MTVSISRPAVVRALAGALSAVVASAAGCGRPDKNYETEIEIVRKRVVRSAPDGTALTMDIEFSFEACPGNQIEVIRGDAEFAACMAKFAVGERLPAHIRHFISKEGHLDYAVEGLADCVRPPDPLDEASFRMIRECESYVVHDAVVGFFCRIDPERKLLDTCPWFERS